MYTAKRVTKGLAGVIDDAIVISFPYKAETVTAVKRLKGASYVGGYKCWTLEWSRENAQQAIQFAEANGFSVSETVKALAA